MNEILTADDFYNDDLTPLENMINFAKIHLQKAQKVWFEKIKSEGLVTEAGLAYLENVYSLDKIK